MRAGAVLGIDLQVKDNIRHRCNEDHNRLCLHQFESQLILRINSIIAVESLLVSTLDVKWILVRHKQRAGVVVNLLEENPVPHLQFPLNLYITNAIQPDEAAQDLSNPCLVLLTRTDQGEGLQMCTTATTAIDHIIRGQGNARALQNSLNIHIKAIKMTGQIEAGVTMDGEGKIRTI